MATDLKESIYQRILNSRLSFRKVEAGSEEKKESFTDRRELKQAFTSRHIQNLKDLQ
jgi:hypothetical protein